MKKYLDIIQNRLMDIFILSIIVCCGLISVIFLPYSVILAIEYNNKKEIKFLNKKKILISFILEVTIVIMILIILLNIRLLPTYPVLFQGISMGLIFIFSIILISLVSISLYLISTISNIDNKPLIRESLILFFSNPFSWLTYCLVLVTTIILMFIFPASIIITLGINVKLIVRICENAENKLNNAIENNGKGKK